jgi:hypothetical protein
MKSQRVKGTPEKLQDLMDEAHMLGYDAELDGDELVIYYGQAPRKQHKPKVDKKPDQWSKRERNFGYTRG